jgi:hypothetical protein
MKKIIASILPKVLISILLCPIIGFGLFKILASNINISFSVSVTNGNVAIKDDFNQIIRTKSHTNTKFERIETTANEILPDLYLDLTFTEFEQRRITKAYNTLAKVVRDPELSECIDINTTSVIYFKKLTKPLGALITQPLLNSRENMYITKYISDSDIGGNAQLNIVSGVDDPFRININTKHSFSSSESDVLELVEIISHESAHNSGYKHKGRLYSQDIFTQFRGNGVYVFGWCAANIAQKYL